MLTNLLLIRSYKHKYLLNLNLVLADTRVTLYFRTLSASLALEEYI